MSTKDGNAVSTGRTERITVVITPNQMERVDAVRVHEAEQTGRMPSRGGLLYEYALAAINRKFERISEQSGPDVKRMATA